MVMKFCGWLQLGERQVYLATICHSCLDCMQASAFTPRNENVLRVLEPNESVCPSVCLLYKNQGHRMKLF